MSRAGAYRQCELCTRGDARSIKLQAGYDRDEKFLIGDGI